MLIAIKTHIAITEDRLEEIEPYTQISPIMYKEYIYLFDYLLRLMGEEFKYENKK